MPSLYAGLDVSQGTTAICVVDAKGAVVLHSEAMTSPDAIARVLRPIRSKLKIVGQEAGNIAPFLEQELRRARFPMICLDAGRAHATLKGRLNKTDKNDAHGLALLLASGLYSRSYVKSNEAIRVRAFLVLREATVRKARDLRGVVNMTERRLVVDKKVGRRKLQTDSQLALSAAMSSVKASAKALLVERDKLEKVANALAKDNDVCARLMTIPGVGPIAALTFFAAVDDPKRFETSRDVGAYFGLTPRTFQSGEITKSGGISHRGDSAVRKALYIAAQSLVLRAGTNCSLRNWGRKIARTKGARVAYVAVARRLAVLMHHLWVTGAEFDPTR